MMPYKMYSKWSGRGAASIGIGMWIVVAACSAGDVVSIPEAETREKFWALRSNAHAVTVAVDSTHTLLVTPYNAMGEEMSSLPKPTFRSADATSVSVDSNGVITGHKSTTGVSVIASLTVDGVTRADTITVAVTAQPIALKSLSIVGLPPDPIVLIEADGYTFITAAVKDSSDMDVYGIAVEFISLDTTIATATIYGLTGKRIGKTKIIASTTSYGKTLADTVEIGVLYARQRIVYASKSVPHTASVIGVNGTVTWTNFIFPAQSIDIIFDAPNEHIVNESDANGPHIVNLTNSASAVRKFTAPGIYSYQFRGLGLTGAVIVYEQPTY